MRAALRTAGCVAAFDLLGLPALALEVTDLVKVNEVSYDPVENPEPPYEYMELYNAGSTTAYLDGAAISDEGNNGGSETTFKFPGTPGGTTIPLAPQGFMLLVGDATGSPFAAIADFEFYAFPTDTDDPTVPNLTRTAGTATNFFLGNGGDGVTLSVGTATGGVIPCNQVVDGMSYEGGGTGDVYAMSRTVCADPGSHPGYTDGGSSGLATLQRCPNGSDTDNSTSDFVALVRTPRAANVCADVPPAIADLHGAPCNVTADTTATLTCRVSDENGDIASVRAFFKLDIASGFDSLDMSFAPPDSFRATLPAQADQAHVLYYVEARDSTGNVVREPGSAPGSTPSYRVGLQEIASLQVPAIQDSCAASTEVGKTVNVTGVVTHRAYEFGDDFFYIQQGTAANSGMRVYTPIDSSFVPDLGDSVRVSGRVDEYYCQTEVVLFAGCGAILRHGCQVEARRLVNIIDIDREENESMLVTVQRVIPVATGFDSTNLGREFKIGSFSQSVYVGDDTFYPDGIAYSVVPEPGLTLQAITGIVACRRTDTTPPGFRADTHRTLRLEPRRDNDVDVYWTDAGDPDGIDVMRAFQLRQNVPNPFNPATRIEFAVPHGGRVLLRIYDARGAVVRRLLDREYTGPVHERVAWDGHDDAGKVVPSGVYFYELQAGSRHAIRKMLLLK